MTRIKAILFSIVISFVASLHAQVQFVKTLETNNNRRCLASCLDANDNIFIAGYNEDLWQGELIKVNQYGMLEWAVRIGPASSSAVVLNFAVASANNQIYTGGGFDSAAYVCSFSQTGQMLWSTHFDIPGSSGNVVLKIIPVGTSLYVMSRSYVSGDWRPNIFKLDIQGNILWSKIYMIGSYPGDMIYLANSDEFVFSTFDFSGSNLIYVDTNGTTRRSFRYNTIRLQKIASINDSTVVVIGANSFSGFPAVLCTTTDGINLWSELLNDSTGYIMSLESVGVSSDNCIYIGTNSLSAAMGPPCALIKMSETGAIVWSKGYFNPTPAENSILGIHELLDGNLFLAGSHPTTSYMSVYALKEDTSSAVSCVSFPFITVPTAINVGTSTDSVSDSITGILNLTPQLTVAFFTMNQYYDCPTDLADFSFEEIIVYPNPATDVVNFQLNSNSEHTIVITNEMGQIILRMVSVNSVVPVPVGALANGFYYYQITDSDSRQMNGKFIVQH